MLNQLQARRLVPWAWSAAWLLTGVGIWLSDVYSSPSRSLVPYFALSALGWGIAGFITASAARGKPGLAVRLLAWGIAWLVAILLGLVWLHQWNMAFFGPIVATGLAGAIGGVASSSRPGMRRLASTVLLGAVFLLFALVGFYASFFLMFVYTSIAQHGGDVSLISALIWPLPGAVCGLLAGLAARRILGLTRLRPPSLLS
jgi:hypothetical protein